LTCGAGCDKVLARLEHDDVDVRAQRAESLANKLPYQCGVLTAPGGEDDRVEPAERRRHRGDRSRNAVGEDLEREPRALVRGALELLHPVRSGEAEQA